MSTDPMLPDPPSAQELRDLGLAAGETRVINPGEVWWRVHRTDGADVLGWNALRTYGPLLRFDPPQLPVGKGQSRHGVWYGASTPDAALAEAFHVDRTIDRGRQRPYLTGISFRRVLTVLDVATDSDGAWATRAGGQLALSTGRHEVTQSGVRRIIEAQPDLDGLRYNSRFAGAPCLALFAPAAAAMPDRPVLSLPLTHPDLASRIAGAARRHGYTVV
jgi:hypothetical protein